MIKKEQVYWDSSVFLGWFLNENDRVEKCKAGIELAQKEKLIILTSAITLTEVIKIKGQKPLQSEQEEEIKKIFEYEYIKLINIDRYIAEDARHLIWTYPHLHPKDSIHLASAIKEKIPVLNSFDDHFLKLNGKFQNIVISQPNFPRQLILNSQD
ncbi:MAG: hypothetical protein A2Y25_00360 [Candidatus Melainabacteria bacterium GWF2_37_15]|nr:MAG: hypothetical protein A2Y25_00360 [Candidatus Melainabacteria bacterium GWF2_37_15]